MEKMVHKVWGERTICGQLTHAEAGYAYAWNAPRCEECAKGVNADYTRGYHDGAWGTYTNPMASADYDRGHAAGSEYRAAKVRDASSSEVTR